MSERGPFSVILQCEFCKFKFARLEVGGGVPDSPGPSPRSAHSSLSLSPSLVITFITYC